MKNKKKWIFLFILLVPICGFIIAKIVAPDNVSFAFPQGGFIELTNGTHIVNDIDVKPGRYAIYAVDGTGEVNIDGVSYELDSNSMEEIMTEMQGFWSILRNGAIYTESPKIVLNSESVIIVKGDDHFKITFLQNDL